MLYEKNGKIVAAGSGSVVIGNRRIFNPTADMLIAAGYVPYTPSETEPVVIPKRYSQLRIIRTLGDQWPEYRRQLEYAGLLDEFFAAEYLAEDDPAFVAFMSQVPPEVAEKLKECEI